MFAAGRFGNVVSDHSFHLDAFFSFFGCVSFSFTRNKRERNEHERRKLCLCLTPPPLVPPLTEVNLTGEGNATPALRSRSDANVTFAPHPYPPPPRGEGTLFLQKPAFQRYSKFFEHLIQATAPILKSSPDANIMFAKRHVCFHVDIHYKIIKNMVFLSIKRIKYLFFLMNSDDLCT